MVTYHPSHGPVVLCIMDGWGHRTEQEHNAVALAKTPVFDALIASQPHSLLAASGADVGLPDGQVGNSEVGHMNIGAGRVVMQDLPLIDAAVANGSLSDNPGLTGLIDKLRASGGVCHLLGLASPGGVHSHQSHLIALAGYLDSAGIETRLHAFLDGRDVPPSSALGYVGEIEAATRDMAGFQTATVCGRYWAMDRDTNWDRVERAYVMLTDGAGESAGSAAEAIQRSYDGGVTDEFVEPLVIGDYTGMADGDGILMFNFRADRAREILAALCQPNFDAFDTAPRVTLSAQMGMVSYSHDHDTYLTAAFPKRDIPNTLGAWVAHHGKRQFRLAETEKYPHVTFFMNGGLEVPAAGEDRFMPSSPKVATYDMQPEMSAAEVTERFVAAIEQGYDLIITNYANPDMVGHTGDLAAAIAACEAVDHGLGQVVEALERCGGKMIVTADHGNCEMMIDPITGGPHTAHTTNLVPIIGVGLPQGCRLRAGRLADLAPTVLELMNLPKPDEMTGHSLITHP